MNKRLAYSLLACAAFSAPARSAPSDLQCAKQSPPHAVALLELYTSEGCDSCPPADRWIRRTAGTAYGTDQLVPLSLHVDYWDRLGWKDRFGDRKFSERQHDLAALARTRVIYTPEVFLNLHEFRDWHSAAGFRDAVRQINARPAGAAIRLEIGRVDHGHLQLRVRFRIRHGAAAERASAVIALYENKLVSEVAAGENRGVTLHHDYVVREWLGPFEFSNGTAEYDKTIAIDRTWNRRNLGVAAFVQDRATREVLQASALPVCSAAFQSPP